MSDKEKLTTLEDAIATLFAADKPIHGLKAVTQFGDCLPVVISMPKTWAELVAAAKASPVGTYKKEKALEKANMKKRGSQWISLKDHSRCLAAILKDAVLKLDEAK